MKKRLGVFFLLLLAPLIVHAGAAEEVAALIEGRDSSPGVVFDIMTGEHDALERLLPEVIGYVERIRAGRPGLDMVVVSHGDEMFALKREQAFVHGEVHENARRLVGMQVTFHVCGALAGMRGVDEGAFVDFIDVSPSGPAQVNDYRALGYRIVFIGDPNFVPRP
ncbi:MAG: DsrE family protein [Halothiobacillaceae bacterium]|nr:DsrE family protein [Halothiobacillaceae bacterium]